MDTLHMPMHMTFPKTKTESRNHAMLHATPAKPNKPVQLTALRAAADLNRSDNP